MHSFCQFCFKPAVKQKQCLIALFFLLISPCQGILLGIMQIVEQAEHEELRIGLWHRGSGGDTGPCKPGKSTSNITMACFHLYIIVLKGKY